MGNPVIPLDDRDARNVSVVGSKAASLGEVQAAGLPVPAGFVVTTSVYANVAARSKDELALLDASRSTSENALNRAAARARDVILNAPLPRGVRPLIRDAWRELGCPAVSVRSSSTAEDLADASFAGQYDSYLNVTGFDDIIRRIKLVWASLHSSHAIGYRRRHGIHHEDAAMAVIVQTQVDPDASGVLFTRDPVAGENRIVVTAAPGLGAGVVDGSAGSDRYVLGPRSGKIVSAEIGDKRIRIVLSEEGGVRSVPIDRGDRKSRCLNDAQLERLAKFGRALAKRFGGPQDIEFAVRNRKIWILQARPMTAVEPEAKPDEPWSSGIDRRYTWRRRGGPLYRLQQDAERIRLRHAKDCYDETGSSMTESHISRVVNGYLYVRANPVGERTLKKRHKLQTARVDASLQKGKSYFEDVLQGIVEDRLNALKRQKRAARSLADLVAYLEACIEANGYVHGNLHWRMGKPGNDAGWHATFREITGEPEHHANVYVQAIQNRMTIVIGLIRNLAKIVQSDPELKRIFLDRDFEALSEPHIARRKKAGMFRRRFRSMMRVYGIRAGHGYGSGSSWLTPTWNMDHTIPYEFIATYVEQDLEKLDRDEQRARRERDNATARMRRRLASDPERLDRFNQALAEARRRVRFLEDHNYYMEQCTAGTTREAIHLAGKALVDRGQIEDPDDVVHFSIDELREIAEDDTACDLRRRVAERADLRERRRRMNAPPILGRKPKEAQDATKKDRPAGLDGSLIRGESASSGQVTGRAVVTRADVHPRIHPGDILVAPNVGPDWTPLFATIGGLVLDTGNLGQHAALVAREYGIPSVMQTKEASKVIQNGQRIRVDGDAGTVELQ